MTQLAGRMVADPHVIGQCDHLCRRCTLHHPDLGLFRFWDVLLLFYFLLFLLALSKFLLCSGLVFDEIFTALFVAMKLLWRLMNFFFNSGTGLQQLVVTASGPDRPGIVARLSKRVLDSGGNIELSKMARLAGEFSILMLVTFDVT